MQDGKIEYLQMIQGAIERMSTTSAVFKGFAATIVAGISVIPEVSTVALILAFSPMLIFAILDVYYLQLERRYRALYDDVRKGRDVSFDMRPPKVREKKKAKLRIIDLICSPSIILFYGPLLVICIVRSCNGA